jgi:predicted Zn finger-like uncharacterized protein
MRLTCPNCGAEYEAPRNMLPAGGRHVQCSACHTRWFARGDARPMLSEDQIIRRLESRGPNLKVVEEPEAAAWDDRTEEPAARPAPVAAAAPSGRPAPEAEDAAKDAAEDFEWEILEAPASPPVRAPDPPPAPATAPAPAATPTPSPAPAAQPAPAPPRPAPEAAPPPRAPSRLELGDVSGEAEAAPKRQNLFTRGFLFAVAAFGVLLLCYLLARPLETGVPVLGPVLGAYADGVDLMRAWLANAVSASA